MKKTRIGIIGCGNISGNYLTNAKNFPILDMAVCADIDVERARAKAKEFNVPKACSVDELLRDDSIEIIINLTIPAVHAEISLAAIEQGKHVWTEKPLAITLEDGRRIVAAAKAKGVRVGGAPDTFFGAGHQTARRLIDQGAIGRPLAATAFMLSAGHEGWHPDPSFFYKPGGGPMLDMGPYYVTDLLQLLGPVKRIVGIASIVKPRRTITSQPKAGQIIDVETPDHIAGTMEFESGAVATIITSFATRFGASPSPITIFGEEGTIYVPDPNGFDGAVRMRRTHDAAFEEVPFKHTTGYGRSVGVADMASAIQTGRAHRGSAEQVFTTLDIMLGFIDSSKSDRAHHPAGGYQRPAAMPTGLKLGEMD